MKDYKNPIWRIVASIIDALGVLFFSPFQSRPSLEAQDIKRILILKFDRIGDSFLSLPTISGLRQIFPRAEVVVAVAPWNQEVFLGQPAIDRQIVVADLPDVHKSGVLSFFKFGHISRLKRLIKEYRPEMVVDLQMSPMNALAAYQSRVKYRLGYRPKILSWLFNITANYERTLPQAEIYFSLARRLGFNDSLPKAQIYPSLADHASAAALASPGHYAVFHLGVGRSYRQWPVANFSALANLMLAADKDVRIVVIGHESDKKLLFDFKSQINNQDRLVDLIGQTSLGATFEILSLARLFVGNESGPGHLAASLNIPVFSLMSPWSGVERWQARGQKVTIFYKSAHKCRGPKCREIPCPNMAAITVDEVWAKVKNII